MSIQLKLIPNAPTNSLDELLKESQYYKIMFCPEEKLAKREWRSNIGLVLSCMGIIFFMLAHILRVINTEYLAYFFIALVLGSVIGLCIFSQEYFTVSAIVKKEECKEIIKMCKMHAIAQQYRDFVVSQGRIIRNFDRSVMQELIQWEREQQAFNQLNKL